MNPTQPGRGLFIGKNLSQVKETGKLSKGKTGLSGFAPDGEP
jgi:hypothetical protein